MYSFFALGGRPVTVTVDYDGDSKEKTTKSKQTNKKNPYEPERPVPAGDLLFLLLLFTAPLPDQCALEWCACAACELKIELAEE